MSTSTTSAAGSIAPTPVPDLSDLVGNTEEFFSGVWRRTPTSSGTGPTSPV
jgi:hypothetical protein